MTRGDWVKQLKYLQAYANRLKAELAEVRDNETRAEVQAEIRSNAASIQSHRSTYQYVAK